MAKTSIFVYFVKTSVIDLFLKQNVDGFVFILLTYSQNFNPGRTARFEKKAFEMSSFQSPSTSSVTVFSISPDLHSFVCCFVSK